MFIDPIAFHIGPIDVHWYGIIIATGVVLGAVLGTAEARRRGEDPEHGWSMLLWVIVAGVIAARLYHVVSAWGSIYAKDPLLIPQVWNGGLGIPGAIMGGALAIWWYTRHHRLSFTRWLDIFAPALLLGQVIGRLGNFVNQELYGPPISQCGTNGFPPCLPWGIQIDAAHRVGSPWDAASFPVATTHFVPLFAYEMALNIVGVALLLYIGRRFARRLYDGDILLLYIVWYGWVRSFLEMYRTENWFIGPLPTATWLGLLGIVVAGGLFIVRHRMGWGEPGAWMNRTTSPRAQPDETDESDDWDDWDDPDDGDEPFPDETAPSSEASPG